MRVLLVKSASVEAKDIGNTPPLGLMYLASHLRTRMPAEIRIVDLKFVARRRRHLVDLVNSFRPQVVGISTLTAEAPVAMEAARAIKEADASVPVIAGGPHPSSFIGESLEDGGVDVVVIGEGEETFAELVELIRSEGPGWKNPAALARVKGVAYRVEGEDGFVKTPARTFIQDLDSLPLPAWDLVDLKRYWKIPSMATVGIRPYMTVFTSRGCPYQCTFCHKMFGRKFRARSAASVIGEFEELKRRYGLNDIEIVDDIANLDNRRFKSILSGMLERDLNTVLNFPNAVRADLLEEDTVKLLKEAGAGEISVAVESASPRMQGVIKKHLDLDKVSRSIALLASHRILTRGFFMLGLPGETEQEMKETIDFACDSRLHLACFFIANPYKGTELWETYRQSGTRMDTIDYFDYEYYGSKFNFSAIPDERFRKIYRSAYFRFYSSPSRLYRMLRDRPYRSDLLLRLYDLVWDKLSFRRLKRY